MNKGNGKDVYEEKIMYKDNMVVGWLVSAGWVG